MSVLAAQENECCATCSHCVISQKRKKKAHQVLHEKSTLQVGLCNTNFMELFLIKKAEKDKNEIKNRGHVINQSVPGPHWLCGPLISWGGGRRPISGSGPCPGPGNGPGPPTGGPCCGGGCCCGGMPGWIGAAVSFGL